MAERISRDFIQLLLAKVDIVELIDGRMPLRKKTGSNFFACCPFHTEKSPSFSVSQAKQFYYCFGCGAYGNAIDFLIQYDRMSFPEAITSLARLMGMEIPLESRPHEKPVVAANLYELMNNIAVFYQQQLKLSNFAIEYLKKRGLSGAIAKDFGIGYAPPGWELVLEAFGTSAELKMHLQDVGMLIKKDEGGFYDRFRDRIMFPILDRRGRIIGFGGRILDKGEPKYLNSPETALFQKGQELYGLYQATKANRDLTRIVIVEGYMDVIALFQHEITYAVATMGTATTANHLQRLFRYTSEIVFCFDGDSAGKTAAWRALLVALPLLQDGIQIRFMFLPDGEDPDSIVRAESKTGFEQRMQDAMTLSNFFYQSIAQQADLTSKDGRARFVKLALDHLQPLPDGIFRQMMVDELSQRARVNVAELQKITQIAPASPNINLVQKARSPSMIRLAITLLIQYPHLANVIDKSIEHLDLPGFELLMEILGYITDHPGLSTGGLLEHWRDRKEGELLAKLAQTEHMIPEIGIEKEFVGILDKLQKLNLEQTINQLLLKANQGNLTSSEKHELQELITSK
jgi:DNA primase